jgi:serine protease Do
VPVYETSAALTPGMSGGPTVDLEGRVLGINSFMPAGESQAFNVVAPASGLTELLSRNGVRNELGPDDTAFRAALDAYYAGHYTDAIAGFDKLLQVAPQHAQALQYRTLAAKARDRFGDVPVAPAPSSDASPVLFWAVVGGGAVLAAGLAVLLVVLVRRRRTPSATLPVGLPATPFPGYGPIPAQAQPPRAEKVLVHRPWPGVAPTATTVDLRTLNGAGVATVQRTDCARCGTRMAAEAKFCSTCGHSRG